LTESIGSLATWLAVPKNTAREEKGRVSKHLVIFPLNVEMPAEIGETQLKKREPKC